MSLRIRKFQKIHADLWGPLDLFLLSGKIHVLLPLDKFTRKSLVFLHWSKNKFFDKSKFWLPCVKACVEKLRHLQIDGGRKFISAALQSFYKKKDITIGYTILYMHKENKIAKWCWRTLAIIKDSSLIDSCLPVNLWPKAIDTANNLHNQLLTREESLTFLLKEA